MARRSPTHRATGTLTALPTIFQRAPSPRRSRPSTPGNVQSASKPWSRSASRIFRGDDASVRQPDGGRGRDTDRRAAFQRRDRIHRPAKPSQPFGPVETVRRLPVVYLWRRSRFFFEQKWTGTRNLRSKQDDSLAALREPEGASVDNAIRPVHADTLKFGCQVAHAFALVEVKHERDVLQHEPPRRRGRVLHEPDDFAHESRSLAADTCGAARLAEVLTWEARDDQVNRGKALDRADIADQLGSGKLGFEDPRCVGIDLAEEGGLVSCCCQTEFDPAYPSEQARDSQTRSGTLPLHDTMVVHGRLPGSYLGPSASFSTRTRSGEGASISSSMSPAAAHGSVGAAGSGREIVNPTSSLTRPEHHACLCYTD